MKTNCLLILFLFIVTSCKTVVDLSKTDLSTVVIVEEIILDAIELEMEQLENQSSILPQKSLIQTVSANIFAYQTSETKSKETLKKEYEHYSELSEKTREDICRSQSHEVCKEKLSRGRRTPQECHCMHPNLEFFISNELYNIRLYDPLDLSEPKIEVSTFSKSTNPNLASSKKIGQMKRYFNNNEVLIHVETIFKGETRLFISPVYSLKEKRWENTIY